MKNCQPAKSLTLSAMLITTLSFSAETLSGVKVSDDIISWDENGWMQVQSARDYSTICEGGTSCQASPGVYIVINHTTSQRYENVVVKNKSLDTGHSHEEVVETIIPTPPALASVIQTGQTQSAYQFDDGELQAGEALSESRFGDNFNGTFHDKLTDLIWLSVRDCITDQTWTAAMDFANNLASGNGTCEGLTDNSQQGDWRLPNIKELNSLINYGKTFPVWDNNIPFTGTWDSYPWGDYWSSTSFHSDLPSFGWFISAEFGRSNFKNKSESARTWAVREGTVGDRTF